MKAVRSISTILVPVDGSKAGERALPWAKAVARDSAEIVLLEVMPVASSVRSIGGQIIGSAETIQEGYRQIAEQQLNDAIGRWFGSSDKVKTRIVAGDPGEQILAVAAALEADLIVMSSHGRGAVGRFVSGSVADRVMRQAPVPVMIVGPDGESGRNRAVGRIIAPVEDTPLSLSALPVAASLSRQTGAPVTVVHVVTPATDLTGIDPSMVSVLSASADDMATQRMEVAAQATVDKAVRLLAKEGIDAESELYSGRPASSIIAVLLPGDVIVISSHSRQGLARWVIGSTSMKLIRNGSAPVVVVTRDAIERTATDQAHLGH